MRTLLSKELNLMKIWPVSLLIILLSCASSSKKKFNNFYSPIKQFRNVEVIDMLTHYEQMPLDHLTKTNFIHLCVEYENRELIKYAFNKFGVKNKPDVNGLTPLMMLAKSTDKGLIRFFMSYSPFENLNYRDKFYNTALMDAASLGNLYFVKLLIKNGATVEDFNKDGLTALTLAMLNDHNHVVKYLRPLYADTDWQGQIHPHSLTTAPQ